MAQNRISVVYITDEKYAMPTCISAYSLICNQGKDTHIVLYFVCDTISDLSQAKFNALSAKNVEIRIIEVKNSSYIELAKRCLANKNIHVSYAAMYKFNLPQILENENKVLYIDGDTLIQKSLLDLYNTSLEGYYVASVDDILQRVLKPSPVRVENTYFNSGVMLMNLKKMREDSMTEKLIDYRTNGVNFFMDQDSLNVVLGIKRLALPFTYNFMITLVNYFDAWEVAEMTDMGDVSNVEDIIEQVAILHLTDQMKPWIYYVPWFSEIFRKYYNDSPYEEEKLTLLNPIRRYKDEVVMLQNKIEALHSQLQGESFFYPYEQVICDKKIILYGAGKKGKEIQCRIVKLCTICAWVDRDYEQIANGLDEAVKEVQSPEIIKTMDFDYVLVSIVNQQALMNVKKYLMEDLCIPSKKIVTVYERKK